MDSTFLLQSPLNSGYPGQHFFSPQRYLRVSGRPFKRLELQPKKIQTKKSNQKSSRRNLYVSTHFHMIYSLIGQTSWTQLAYWLIKLSFCQTLGLPVFRCVGIEGRKSRETNRLTEEKFILEFRSRQKRHMKVRSENDKVFLWTV